jgi:hypothetical protein
LSPTASANDYAGGVDPQVSAAARGTSTVTPAPANPVANMADRIGLVNCGRRGLGGDASADRSVVPRLAPEARWVNAPEVLAATLRSRLAELSPEPVGPFIAEEIPPAPRGRLVSAQASQRSPP